MRLSRKEPTSSGYEHANQCGRPVIRRILNATQNRLASGTHIGKLPFPCIRDLPPQPREPVTTFQPKELFVVSLQRLTAEPGSKPPTYSGCLLRCRHCERPRCSHLIWLLWPQSMQKSFFYSGALLPTYSARFPGFAFRRSPSPADGKTRDVFGSTPPPPP